MDVVRDERKKRLFPSSLRTRLFLLILLAVVPAFGLTIYTAEENISLKRKEIVAEAQRLTRLAVSNIEMIFEGERNLLISLSELPAVGKNDSAACSMLFHQVKEHLPVYANLFAFKPNGDVFCSAARLTKKVNASDMFWFQKTINTRDFSTGEYQMGKIIGRPVIVSGYPVVNNRGRLLALVGASFDLITLNKILSKVQLPEGAVLTLIDYKGTILTRNPGHEVWMGKSILEAENIRAILRQQAGTAEAAGEDGVKRIYSFMPVEGTGGSVYVSVGIPMTAAFRAVKRLLVRDVILLGVFAVLALTAAWIIGNIAQRFEDNLKKSEERYRRNEEYLAQLMNTLGDAVFNVRLPERSIEYVNRAAESIFGYLREEMIGQSTRMFYSDDADYTAFGKRLQDALAQGQKQFISEVKLWRKDRQLIWGEIYTTILIRDGKPAAVISVVRDITERKKAEDALRESEEKFRMLFESAVDGIFILDMEGRFIDANHIAYERLGYAKDEMLAKNIKELDPPEFAVRVPERMALIQKHGQAVFESAHFRKDGSVMPVEINTRIIDYGGRKVFFSIIRDITERKKNEAELKRHRDHLEELVNERTGELLEAQKELMTLVEDLERKRNELAQANERLKELDRLKSMFIASMSHELRTPLNSIIGFSSILHDEWLGPLNDEQKINLFAILKSGRHLLELVNDVIDVSKIEAGKIEIHPEDFDIERLITEAVDLFKKEAGEKGLELEVESVHLKMHADRRRLFQCVVNLISNAVKFTSRGSVSVQARLGNGDWGIGIGEKKLTPNNQQPTLYNDFIEIIVEDTGIGIKAEDLPKLFQPFVRLHTMSNIPGTGLGLYLTKKLVTEILKGDIIVESEVGKGSKFTIKIPARI